MVAEEAAQRREEIAMSFEAGLGNGRITNRKVCDRQLAALCAIPKAKLIAAASSIVGMGAASNLSQGQLIDTIGVVNALALSCSCSGGSLGSLLGDAGDDFTSGDTVVTDPSATPLDPNLLPNLPEGPLPSAPDPGLTTPPISGDGFPAAPPFRAGNWKNDGAGHLLNSYFIAPGDTWSGLARLYLGGPTRWKELWQPNSGQFPDPDVLSANVFVVMPAEATQAAQAILDQQLVPVAPPSPGAPGSVPGAAPVGPSSSSSNGLSKNAKIAIGVGAGVLVLGGITYAAVR